jgi:site-specific recombinase XerD
VNKYLNRASSLFKFAVRNGFMDRNPAEGMQIEQGKRDDEFRSTFSREDLEKLFNSEEYLQDKHRSSYHGETTSN